MFYVFIRLKYDRGAIKLRCHTSHNTAGIFLILIVEEGEGENGVAYLFYRVNVYFGVIIEPRSREKKRLKEERERERDRQTDRE